MGYMSQVAKSPLWSRKSWRCLQIAVSALGTSGIPLQWRPRHRAWIPRVTDRAIHEAVVTSGAAMNIPQNLGRRVLATVSDAIIAADRDCVIRFWNPGAERGFGYASGEAAAAPP